MQEVFECNGQPSNIAQKRTMEGILVPRDNEGEDQYNVKRILHVICEMEEFLLTAIYLKENYE